MDYAPRQFVSTNGLTILVGRNARENSRLTLKESGPADLFFHVTDFPGSHVVLKHHPDIPILQADRLDAAQLAAYYSKAKKKTVAVDYTAIKHVSKPRGKNPAGIVEITKATTVKVVIDTKRLAELGVA